MQGMNSFQTVEIGQSIWNKKHKIRVYLYLKYKNKIVAMNEIKNAIYKIHFVFQYRPALEVGDKIKRNFRRIYTR